MVVEVGSISGIAWGEIECKIGVRVGEGGRRHRTEKMMGGR